MLQALHTVVGGLVRRTWLVALATITVCAVFAAHAVAALAEPGESSSTRLREVPPPSHVAPTRVPVTGDALVARNMFCSACTPSVEPGPAGIMVSFVPGATLIATSVGGDAMSSRATVRVTASEAEGSWALGEEIPSLGVVSRIGYASIDLRDADGRIGRLSLLETAKVTEVAGAATPAASPASPANPYDERVRKIDDHQYDVDRALVKELVNGASTGKGGIRATPNMKNGEMLGIRMLGVKPDSVPAAIGIKSGDTIESVDGEPIKSAQQMIDLYTKLDKYDTVSLGGTRGGKPLTLRLNLK